MRTPKLYLWFVLVLTFFIGLLAEEKDIFKAVEKGNLDQVTQLVEKVKKLLEIKDETGMSLLHVAAFRGHKEIVEYLLSEGIDPDIENPRKLTPLMGAVYFGHKDTAAVLLDLGADIDHKDSRGSVPLRFAIDQGDEEMVKFLIEKDASLDISCLLYTSPSPRD